jgi:hypothetical protein
MVSFSDIFRKFALQNGVADHHIIFARPFIYLASLSLYILFIFCSERIVSKEVSELQYRSRAVKERAGMREGRWVGEKKEPTKESKRQNG